MLWISIMPLVVSENLNQAICRHRLDPGSIDLHHEENDDLAMYVYCWLMASDHPVGGHEAAGDHLPHGDRHHGAARGDPGDPAGAGQRQLLLVQPPHLRPLPHPLHALPERLPDHLLPLDPGKSDYLPIYHHLCNLDRSIVWLKNSNDALRACSTSTGWTPTSTTPRSSSSPVSASGKPTDQISLSDLRSICGFVRVD